MEYGLIVTVLSLLVVFAVLTLLIFVLYGMRFLNKKGGNAQSSENSEGAIAEIKEDISKEADNMIAAAIAAALQIYCEGEQPNKKASFIVRSIKRI